MVDKLCQSVQKPGKWKIISYRFLIGGFNPFEKYWSKWDSSLNRGKNKRCLKPPPSFGPWAIFLKKKKKVRTNSSIQIYADILKKSHQLVFFPCFFCWLKTGLPNLVQELDGYINFENLKCR